MRMSASGWVSIGSNLLAVALTTAAYHGHGVPLFLPYTWHKLLHILGVIVLVGNITVGPLWVIQAWRSRSPEQLGFAMRTLALADIWFTAPGVQLAVVNGLAMASAFGGLRAQPWLAQSYALILVLALAAPTGVLYHQERAVRLAVAGDNGPAFTRAFLLWSVWGSAVMVPLVLVFYMMVTKHAVF